MDTTVIRQGENKAIVEGLFELDVQTKSALRELLEPEGLWDDEDYLTLGREIRAEGRTIARVNGRMVNLGLQSEIGALLVDLHGQSEHLSLLKHAITAFCWTATRTIKTCLKRIRLNTNAGKP